MKTRTIFLADDDADDRELFEMVIGDHDDVTLSHCFDNGRELIDFLEQIPDDKLPDTIILDHNMPKMNGLETLQFLKSHTRYSPITIGIYSTFNDFKMTEKFQALGAAMVLTKPSKLSDYEMLIQKIVSTPESEFWASHILSAGYHHRYDDKF